MKNLNRRVFLLFTIASLFQISSVAYGQAPIIEWQKTFGGNNNDDAYCIQQTSDGGYVIAGTAQSVDGDVTGNHGQYDMWIVKINSSRIIQWQKCLGGTNMDEARYIRQTTDNGYIIAGSSSSINGDVTGNHGGGGDYWVVKLDSTGNLLWQKCLGGTSSETAFSLELTTDGNYIVAGSSNSINGDVIGHHGTTASSDYWIVKLNSAGSTIWKKSFGGTNNERAFTIKQTSDAGFIIGGYAVSNDGDVTGNHGGLSDAWVIKIDSLGNLQWQKCLGGSADERASSVQQTADGGYIVAGFTRSMDGDVTGNHGGLDSWVIKLNSAGGIQWQKCFGGSNGDWTESIQVTSDGGFIAVGTAYSTDGDVTGLHGTSGGDYWVLKLNSSGLLLWQKTLGGSNFDWGNFVVQTSDGDYVIAGMTGSNDGNVSGNHSGGIGRTDYWIVRLDGMCSLPSTPSPIISSGGNMKVCPGDTRIYTVNQITGATYHWSVPIGATINSGQGSRSINVTYNSGFIANGVISVYASNTCGNSSTINRSVNRNVPATPSPISGTNYGLCGASNQLYSVTNVSGVTYNWTVPVGAIITNGQGTNSIRVNFPSTNFTGQIAVTANNACGPGPARKLTVRAVPVTPAIINGDITVCSNSFNRPYSITPVTNATNYTWTAPPGSHVTANGVTSLNNILTTTSITVAIDFGTVTSTSTVKVKANNNCGSGGTKSLRLIACTPRIGNRLSGNSAIVCPNPFKTTLTLVSNLTTDNNYVIQVSDQVGKTVMKETIYLNAGLTEHQLDLQELNPGLYFLTITSPEDLQVIKVFKE